VGVRPEIATLTDDAERVLSGRVVFQEDLGASLLTTIALGSERADGAAIAWVEELGEADIPSSSPRLRISSQRGRRHPSDTPVKVRLELERLMFFDPVTKLAID
jgi:ABC-type sugar transport system ATPase subunit